MIFVTVGTELPFDRMVRVVDDWAREHSNIDVFAQIGNTTWQPSYITYTAFLDSTEINRWFARASAVVAHAGMGTILSALRYEKPIVVMPRRAALGEQRNDHQLATAKRLLELGKIHVAMDEINLCSTLDNISRLSARANTGPYANPELIATLREFVDGSKQAEAIPAFVPPLKSPAVPVRVELSR